MRSKSPSQSWTLYLHCRIAGVEIYFRCYGWNIFPNNGLSFILREYRKKRSHIGHQRRSHFCSWFCISSFCSVVHTLGGARSSRVLRFIFHTIKFITSHGCGFPELYWWNVYPSLSPPKSDLGSWFRRQLANLPHLRTSSCLTTSRLKKSVDMSLFVRLHAPVPLAHHDVERLGRGI